MRIPIHREGWPFIATFAGVNAALYWLSPYAGVAFAPLSLWCIAFFRDPERTPPPGENLLVSPADGVLLPITDAAPPEELGLGGQPRKRLSIFMNVFDVHVNRMPVSGEVVALSYRPGRFFNASFDKASVHNERMSLRLRPDRIPIGEVRGAEALDLLKAWGTGHPGGVATLHAGSAIGALRRLEQLIQEAVVTVPRALIAETIDLIAVLAGRGSARRLAELAWVTGLGPTGDYVLTPAGEP